MQKAVFRLLKENFIHYTNYINSNNNNNNNNTNDNKIIYTLRRN